jgi:hypothetical protein
MLPATVLLSSSLRRTLVLPALCSAIIITFLIGCKNPGTEQKKIFHDFDSINNQLKKIENLLKPSDSLYDSLLQVASDKGGESQQLYYHLTDFHGYMDNFRYNFYGFAGDKEANRLSQESEDSIELTNAFLKTRGFTTDGLSAYLLGAIEDLRPFTQNRTTLDKMEKFKLDFSAKNLAKMFKDAPPVAAVTMLNFLEHKVKETELDILKEYFHVH